jgi:hypothetical protein
MLPKYLYYYKEKGSFFLLPTHGSGGARATINIKAPQKNRAKPEKQKGKKEGGLGEGIFALLRIKIERFRKLVAKASGNAPHSCLGFSLKKVRISFRIRSQIVCSAFVASALRASARALRALRPDFKRICHAPRGSKTNSRSRKIRFAVAKQQNSANGGIANLFFSPLWASYKAIIIPTDVGIAQKQYY